MLLFHKRIKATISYFLFWQVWRLENEFYNFALDHFHFLVRKGLHQNVDTGEIKERGSSFNYEKIKPKRGWLYRTSSGLSHRGYGKHRKKQNHRVVDDAVRPVASNLSPHPSPASLSSYDFGRAEWLSAEPSWRVAETYCTRETMAELCLPWPVYLSWSYSTN